jgi:hypothetical protein
MPNIKTRQDLSDYCLRALGAPVLNIEVADEQLEDAIDTAIRFWHEYHPDGVIRDYFKHLITSTVMTLSTVVGLTTGTVLLGPGNTQCKVLNIIGSNVTVSKIMGRNVLKVGDAVISNSGFSATITAITLGTVDLGYLEMDEGVYGVLRVVPFMGYGDQLFDIMYQLRFNDLRTLHSGTMNYFTGSMEYLALLDFFLRKEKQFRFNRYMSKLYLDIDWQKDIRPGDYFVVEVLRTVNDSEYNSLLNDIHLKKLASAYVKKYWGTNLRKYNGIQLLGGVTLDGERIIAEAHQEIAALEQEIIQNQAPLSFLVG